MAAAWISPTAHPSEEYECLDCQLVDVLSVHGQCQRCGSSAVLPSPILEQTGTWLTMNGVPYWVPRDSQYPNTPKRPIVAFEHCLPRIRRKSPAKTRVPARQPEKKYA
jgi:hypothetical protein